MVDSLLRALPNGASTKGEWEAMQANVVSPPSPDYDNRPTPGQVLMMMTVTDFVDWKLKAACLGTEGLMFDRNLDEGKIHYDERREKALRVCGSCAVRQECLDYALRNGENYHIWGGMTPKERKNYLKRQKAS